MICSAFTVDSCFLFSSHCTHDQSTTVPIKVAPCVNATLSKEKENWVQSGWTSQPRNDKNDCIPMFCHQHCNTKPHCTPHLPPWSIVTWNWPGFFCMDLWLYFGFIRHDNTSSLDQHHVSNVFSVAAIHSRNERVWCISNNCGQRCFLILLWGAITHALE